MNRLTLGFLCLTLPASAGVTAAAAPETRPVQQSPSELEELRAEVKALREQTASLQREIEQVRASASPTRPATTRSSGPATGPSAGPASTFTDRAKAAGGSDDAAKANLAEAERADAAIRAWLAAHPSPQEIANAMWEGRPAVGMTADALRTFGQLKVLSETASGQIAQLVVPDFKPHQPEDRPAWFLQLTDGKVEIITHP